LAFGANITVDNLPPPLFYAGTRSWEYYGDSVQVHHMGYYTCRDSFDRGSTLHDSTITPLPGLVIMIDRVYPDGAFFDVIGATRLRYNARRHLYERSSHLCHTTRITNYRLFAFSMIVPESLVCRCSLTQILNRYD